MKFMNKKQLQLLAATLILIFLFSSCQKQWLDAKPNQNLATPTLTGLQDLLYQDLFIIYGPSLGEMGADDYSLPSNALFAGRSEFERNIYSWASGGQNFYAGVEPSDWDFLYQQIFNVNIVLEGVSNIIPDTSTFGSWKNVKGSALFYRGRAFYNLAQVFCKPYIKNTSASDLGIILRLNSNLNIPL